MVNKKIGACAEQGSKRYNQNNTNCFFHFEFLSKKKRPPDFKASVFVLFGFNIQS